MKKYKRRVSSAVPKKVAAVALCVNKIGADTIGDGELLREPDM